MPFCNYICWTTLVECLQCILNAMCCCMQLWCAAGVNINGWQQDDTVTSSSVNSASQSDNSTSTVC